MIIVSTGEAVSLIKSGDRVFLQGAAMTLNTLIDALCERYQELKNIEIVSIHKEGEAKYSRKPNIQSFRLKSYFEPFAMPSETLKRVSKITPYLKQGAGMNTTKVQVPYMASEYDVEDLFGKYFKERAKSLLSIVHPDYREKLEKAVEERFKNG